MRRALQLVAVVIALSAAGLWLVTGANRGWTKTSVPRKTLDDVTGIEAITYEKAFKPGIEFLGTALVCAAILAGASLLIRKKPSLNSNT